MKQRTYLFIHQNMPAQFLHLCVYLRDRGHRIVFITRNRQNHLVGITKVIYEPGRTGRPDTHPYLKTLEDGILHGQAVFRSIRQLLDSGFRPDIVIGHAGWGETLFVKDALPAVPVLNYWEFFYNALGQDVGFDPEYVTNTEAQLSLRIKNAIALLTSTGCDWGMTPTQWQYSTHPPGMQAKMSVIHEGIDTDAIRPNPQAVFRTPNGKQLRAGQKIVTFVSRNLEPYRGFHVFMRAIAAIQRRQPEAEILIVGSEGVSYGQQLPEGDSYKKRLLAETSFDAGRVHFTGHLKTQDFRAAMQISAAHVYLTYPFVLSWSMLEAMAAGCLVIGSRTAPVQELITDGVNGLLVDFFDGTGLVDRIDAALSDPAAYAGLRRAARDTIVSRYDLQSICLPRQIGLVDGLTRAG